MASRPDGIAPASGGAKKPRSVLVVDDSAVARLIVQRVINETEQFAVAAHAGTAEEALERLRTTSVDLIILDIEMPGMDGIEAIPHIIRSSFDAPILVVSSHCREDAESSVRAMAMGASDIILKPDSREKAEQFAAALREKMIRLTEREVMPAAPEEVPAAAQPAADAPLQRPIKCLAIGASTGGIHALSTFFSALPRDLDMPILVTQHLPADFMVYFARQLRAISGRKAAPARDGQRVSPSEILVAPGDAHLTVVRSDEYVRISFDRNPAPNGFCPSVDPMLTSVARAYGADAVGVVLTGMGRDGALGAADLAEAGGELLVQDSDSSVIWGMPGAVARQGIASVIAPPGDLAAHVARRGRAFGCS